MKSLLLLAGTVALGLVIVSGSTAPATATSCFYELYHDGHGVVTGKLAIYGSATAFKLDNACDRARRECNRRFERARKREMSLVAARVICAASARRRDDTCRFKLPAGHRKDAKVGCYFRARTLISTRPGAPN